jgi:iron(III) transport system ATP-binding protein
VTGTTPPTHAAAPAAAVADRSVDADRARALRVEAVTKHFGTVTAVDGVSFDVADDELIALVGPSGCGKSTLLRILAGLIPSETGRIELDGTVVDDGRTSVPPERRHVGLVFQEHALFPHLSVDDNIGFGVRTPSAERSRRVAEMLDLVGLAGYGRRFPHELSGGERQRVALARALAPDPSLMLLDEPFASLDPNLRAQIRNDIVHILRSTGTPAVFVTHDQNEALAVGDRVAVMRAGRIVQLGTPEEVFHEPVDTFVAAFMGEADFLDPDDVGTSLAAGLAAETAPTGTLTMIRPDDVVLAVDRTGSATVIDAEFRGTSWCYTVRLASGATIRATRSHLDRLDVGTAVSARLAPGHRPVSVAVAP